MSTLAIIFLYWIFSAIFGNEFIQFSIMGINTFYVLIGLCLVYWALRINSTKRSFSLCESSLELYSTMKLFSIYFILYLALSFFQFFTSILNVNVEYNISYVFRQGYLIFTIPIIFVIVNSFFKNTDYWIFKITNIRNLKILWVMLAIIKFIGPTDHVVYRPLIFAIASMLFLLRPNKIISIIIILFTMINLIGFQSSSSIIGFIVCGLIFVFWKFIIKIIEKNISFKIWLVICILALTILLFSSFAMNLFIDDTSAVWRWQYWVNEFQVLVNSYGLGVGFGTAYASDSIYTEINNSAMFVTTKDGLFIITQHNSYFNFLYRLGVVGFILFIQTWLVKPLKLFSKSIRYISSSYEILIKWGFLNFIFNTIIIVLNPGLESPRFAIGFIFTFGLFIAFCILGIKEKIE